MSESLVIEAVRKTVTVDCVVEEAFRVFTADASSWWPIATHSINGRDVKDVVFEGREGGDSHTSVGVRREYGPEPERPVPGGLVCALLAEWGRQRRANLAHLCSAGLLPPGFRVGPWNGELTAIVPMELPRRALRADQGDPPPKIAPRDARALLEPAIIARLVPSRSIDEPAPAALIVENRTDTRAIVLAQGVAVGWVDAGRSVRIDGFTPGFYRIGAIRPLGVLRLPPRLVRVPSTLVIGMAE